MNQLMTGDWACLLTMLGGLLLGLGLRGFFAVRRERQLAAEHDQGLESAHSLLTERAARVTTVEHQLNDMQIAYDEARVGLEHAKSDIGALRMRIADLEPQAQRLFESQSNLRTLQSSWEGERADLLRQLAALNDRSLASEQTASKLDETRNHLRLAESRYFTLQSEYDHKVSLLDRTLREYEAKYQIDMGKLLSRIAELEPQARTATDWQARHDILQSRAVDNNSIRAQLLAREQRIRELENDLARLRLRVLELEPLHGELQIRDQKLLEIRALHERSAAAREAELNWLRERVNELEARPPTIVEIEKPVLN